MQHLIKREGFDLEEFRFIRYRLYLSEIATNIKMSAFVHDRLACIVCIDRLQLRGVVSDLFTQFTVSRCEERFTRPHASCWHFPAIVLAENVAVLSHHHDVLIIKKGKNTNTLSALDHSIDSRFAVRHLS